MIYATNIAARLGLKRYPRFWRGRCPPGAGDGPEAWPLARRLVRWARALILHGAGDELWHYEIANREAEVHSASLLVECEGNALDAWQRPILATPHRPKIVPRGPHPLSSKWRALQ